MNLLEVKGLSKHYRAGGGILAGGREKVRAVDGVSFSVAGGETLGLVGESGCGKSTLGRLILRLEEPSGGKIFFAGEDITGWSGKRMRDLRGKIQIIFQDAYSSLNPLHTAGSIIGEPLDNFRVGTKEERKRKVRELMEMVGLDSGHAARYAHEFSGGQRQRIGIARALALKPRLIVCDEPVSSLDVSIQAQILNLLKKLKKQFGLSYLFISHNLAAVSHISDRVAVMYLGKVVEVIRSRDLAAGARHPYTRGLLAAVPVTDPRQREIRQVIVRGEPPDPAKPPAGCRFHPRCARAEAKCRQVEPALLEVGGGHQVACHFGG